MRSRRLPGFRFEVQAPPPADVLPRMDVAVFVGFAARGPLHRPVRVEDAAQFEMIFGDDAQLAWDEVRGEPVYAYLAPAVRAFFRNGGRRCWIIRVADQARSNHFPITGLSCTFNSTMPNHITELKPAFAQARSEGSWSDALRVSASLLSRTVALTIVSLDPPEFDVTLNTPDDLVAGDVLRVTFDEGYVLQCAVKSLSPDRFIAAPTRSVSRHVRQSDLVQVELDAVTDRTDGQRLHLHARRHERRHPGDDPAARRKSDHARLADVRSSADRHDRSRSAVHVSAATRLAAACRSRFRSILAARRRCARHRHRRLAAIRWRACDRTRVCGGHRHRVCCPLRSIWWSVCRFELWTRQGQSEALRLSDLTFDLRHARCWDALPIDLELYPEITAVPRQDYASLWQAAANPRFPLAGSETPLALFVPIALPVTPDFYLAPDPQTDDALTRDGLSVFDASLFLDPDLAEVGVRDLLNEADTIRYQALTPRSLQGLHAALSIEEATLIAVPDAVQRGWFYRGATKPNDPPPSDPLLRPEWWHYLDCDPPPEIKPIHEPDWSQFLNCDTFSNLIDPPVLESRRGRSTRHVFIVLDAARTRSGLRVGRSDARRLQRCGCHLRRPG